MSANQLKIVGSAISAIFAGLAFAYPSQAPALASASAFLFGALHIPRPGDVKAAQ